MCVFSKFYECKFSTPFLKITIHSKRANSTPKNRVMPLEKNIFPDSLSSELPDVERTRVVVVVVVVVGVGVGGRVGGKLGTTIWSAQGTLIRVTRIGCFGKSLKMFNLRRNKLTSFHLPLQFLKKAMH